MPSINIFQTIANGSMALYGNTLGVSSGADNIAWYITTDTTVRATTSAPFGTTTDFNLSMSQAEVNLPPMDNLLRAELVWAVSPYGSTYSPNIKFMTPSITIPANALTIIPDYTLTDTNWKTYGADITDLISQEGSGTYGGGGVRTLVSAAGSALGWSIIIAYQKFDLPVRYMTINPVCGLNTTFNFSGFRTVSSGPVEGRIMVMISDGDGSSAFQVNGGLGTINLVGPNNGPGANPVRFTSSQINHGVSEFPNVGLLNTTGTLGNLNWGGFGTPRTNTRYGIDITNVDLGVAVANSRTSITIFAAGAGEGIITNLVAFQLNTESADLDIVKYLDLTTVSNNDVITYTFRIENIGVITATNVLFFDTVPTGTSFIPNTFKYNNTIIPNASPTLGVTLPNFPRGDVRTLSFKVNVDNASAAPLTNNASLRFNYTIITTPIGAIKESNDVVSYKNPSPSLMSEKLSDRDVYELGDNITYTLTVKNTSSVSAENLIFKDTIPPGTSFNSDSFTLNGVTVSPVDLTGGVLIGDLGESSIATITFSVKIIDSNEASYFNTGNYEYDYIFESTTVQDSISTNETISELSLMNIEKFVNKVTTDKNDVLTYTIKVSNGGTATSENVVLFDTLPSNVSFILNTVTVDGITVPSISPATGIALSSVSAGDILTITFKVNVLTTIPSDIIPNTSYINYNFLDPNTIPRSLESNEVVSIITRADLRPTKYVDKAFATCGDSATCS